MWMPAPKWSSSWFLSLVVFAAVATDGCSSGTTMSHPATTCVPPDTGLPTDVFCVGLYANHDQSQVSQDVMPYTPGIVLWSDGAEKHRYLYLPPGTQIDTSNMDVWKFPVGTKVFKEFRLRRHARRDPAMSKRDAATWDVGTYVWSSDGASATLSTDTKGTVLPSGYEIPGTKDCDKCHHGGADRLLGVEAIALALPSAQGLPLVGTCATAAYSRTRPRRPRSRLPEDATGKAADAIGYLHMNCGVSCHSNRGLGNDTGLLMRLRAEEIWPLAPGTPPATAQQTDIYSKSVNSAPTTGAVADHFPGTVRISPGSHDSSLIWLLPAPTRRLSDAAPCQPRRRRSRNEDDC